MMGEQRKHMDDEEVGGGLNGEWFSRYPYYRPKDGHDPRVVSPPFVSPPPDPSAAQTLFEAWCAIWPEGSP